MSRLHLTKERNLKLASNKHRLVSSYPLLGTFQSILESFRKIHQLTHKANQMKLCWLNKDLLLCNWRIMISLIKNNL